MNNKQLSEFDRQAKESINLLDLDEAKDRVQAILKPQAVVPLTPAPQAPPQATSGAMGNALNPANTLSPAPNRKPRSDKGVPKKPPADPDEITLKMNLNDARMAALTLGQHPQAADLASEIQDQIIGHLQKRLDLLTKQK